MAANPDYLEIIEQVLCQCAQMYATPQRSRTLMAFDRDHGQFVLIEEGWEGYRHIHHMWAHVEWRDGQIWVIEDGTEVGITKLLKNAGIPSKDIVLAFRSPAARKAIDAAAAA